MLINFNAMLFILSKLKKQQFLTAINISEMNLFSDNNAFERAHRRKVSNDAYISRKFILTVET